VVLLASVLDREDGYFHRIRERLGIDVAISLMKEPNCGGCVCLESLHVHVCDRRLGPFEVSEKFACNCTSLNSIVDADFIMFTIVICFLRHPILISKLIKMLYHSLPM
jgi:hypothetical protein